MYMLNIAHCTLEHIVPLLTLIITVPHDKLMKVGYVGWVVHACSAAYARLFKSVEPDAVGKACRLIYCADEARTFHQFAEGLA